MPRAGLPCRARMLSIVHFSFGKYVSMYAQSQQSFPQSTLSEPNSRTTKKHFFIRSLNTRQLLHLWLPPPSYSLLCSQHARTASAFLDSFITRMPCSRINSKRSDLKILWWRPPVEEAFNFFPRIQLRMVKRVTWQSSAASEVVTNSPDVLCSVWEVPNKKFTMTILVV